MIQINLIPDVKQEFLHTQKVKRTVTGVAFLVAAVCVGVVVLLAINVYGVQREHINNLTEDVAKYSKEIKSEKDLAKILTVQGQLAALPSLHEEKKVYSRLLDYLSKLTPSFIKLSGVTIGETESSDGSSSGNSSENAITFEGSSDSFRSINQFVDTLKNAEYTVDGGKTKKKAFKKVVLDSAARDTNSNSNEVSFEVSAEYEPELFENGKTILLKVPELDSGTAQDRPTFFKVED